MTKREKYTETLRYNNIKTESRQDTKTQRQETKNKREAMKEREKKNGQGFALCRNVPKKTTSQ